MFFRKAALRPVPSYAVVDAHYVSMVEEALDQHDDELQGYLDRRYAEFDRFQPALSGFVGHELSRCAHELPQSLGYFLSVVVFQAFREAFPTRLREVDAASLSLALETLALDEALRENDPTEALESDDVVAMGQPAVLELIQHHVEEALSQSEAEDADAELPLEQLDIAYRALLVQVIALSHAVASEKGELGPAPETLA